MKIEIHLQDANTDRVIPIHFHDDETLECLIKRIESDADVDGSSIVCMSADVLQLPDFNTLLRDFKFKQPAIHVRRVCVEVHFEGDVAKQFFPIHAHWGRVHRWACREFGIAHAVAANLELHEGSPKGITLNERKEIGPSEGCKQVWLVKPGAEPNG